jgi:hypothetical protein
LLLPLPLLLLLLLLLLECPTSRVVAELPEHVLISLQCAQWHEEHRGEPHVMQGGMGPCDAHTHSNNKCGKKGQRHTTTHT